ncbi:MAG: hypothetical protein ACYCWE_20730 [Eubacteriales bacterium]
MANKLFNIGLQFFAGQNTPAASAGVKGQGTADPVSGKDSVILTGQDIDNDDDFDDIDGDETGTEEVSEDDGDDGDEEDDVPAPKAKGKSQDTDKNAAFAEVRRKAEAEARIKATQEAQRMAAAEIDKAFADMKLLDPYTNKIITSKKEYDAYKARHTTETISKELSKAGISREAIDAMIENHPAVIKAREAAEGFESAKRQSQDTAAKVHLDSQIKEITAIDPAIKTAEDLFAQPNYETIRGYVRKGLTIVEAYKLSNMDKLSGKTAAAAAQSVYNRTQSKEHLTSSAARGQGDIVVPKAVMDNYRRLCPNMTAKEIRADYGKHLKKYS